MPESIRLPRPDGTLRSYRPRQAAAAWGPAPPPESRVAFAAVHVVADPLADTTPVSPARLDWDATLAYRRYIWSLGLGVAEAMDTAQRGMGLEWDTSRELIRLSVAEAAATGATGARVVCGVQTDHLQPGSARSLADVIAAYEEQCAFVEAAGGAVVLMASRELARLARGPDDYLRVYGRVLSQLQRPAIIHWLGEAFDPALAGYWGSADLDHAMTTCLEVLRDHPGKVDGVKLSLLDQAREVEMRRLLPAGVRMYTGDDLDYPTTIRGDGERHSDALLGIFDAIAPVASAALLALDAGDLAAYASLLAPTLPLSRHIFRAPTPHYKTGIVFLAYLNGHQAHFRMVGGLESGRSVVHLSELFVLADQAGLLRDPELAVARMRHELALAGIEG
jgi:Protein of unknown function (DUF993)